MNKEVIFNNNQYQWDMRVLELMRKGKTDKLMSILPEFMEKTAAEVKSGGLTWMLAAMGFPHNPCSGAWVLDGDRDRKCRGRVGSDVGIDGVNNPQSNRFLLSESRPDSRTLLKKGIVSSMPKGTIQHAYILPGLPHLTSQFRWKAGRPPTWLPSSR